MKAKQLSKILSVILFFCMYANILGQDPFSTNTKMLLLNIDKSLQKSGNLSTLSLSARTEKEFLVKTISREKIVNGFILVEPGFNKNLLTNLDVKINSSLDNLLSVTIPLHSLAMLEDIKGIKYVDVDRRARMKLDSARTVTKTSFVNSGTGLPKGFDGKGVVIGVIDGGFDFTHPTFKDSNGNLRIKKVWDQSKTSGGTPPNGYSYGVEYSTPAEILAAQSDGNDNHGVHVAGITGGSGNGSNGKFAGMAPAADFVLVSSGGGSSSIADAIKYIFDYAKSVNKPIVVNMSLGTHIGPHDGTSALDRNIDNLTGAGKIIVGAAGNEGGTKLHYYRDFTVTPNPVSTIISIENKNDGAGTVDIWGSPNSDFSVSLSVTDLTGNVLNTSEVVSASSNNSITKDLNYGAITISYKITARSSVPLNNKPNIQVEVINKSNQHLLVLNCTSTNSKVHFWNHGTGNGTPFEKLEKPDFVEGDVNYTVGEIGGTAKGIITVGAFTSKNQYLSFDGQPQTAGFYTENGAIAPFSSLGPTADERTKPEITAPGNVVISAGSSFKTNQSPQEIVLKVENKWPYVSMQGTSMATPCATGIIALFLQAKHNLTRDDIVGIFKTASIKDTFTGTIPDAGSNTWGFGKINTFESMKLVLSNPNTAPTANISSYYPNPAIAGQPVTFKSVVFDPEEDSVRIKYDWGDGDSTDYYEYSDSGEEITTTHIFKTEGDFSIREEAEDEHGLDGEWSQPFTVKVITAPNTATIKGRIIYANSSNTSMSNVKVYLLNSVNSVVDSTIASNDGIFVFAGKEKGNYSFNFYCSKPWDGVNATDALLIRKFQAGTATFDALQLLSADVNNSKSINSTDALLIRRRITGMDNSFAAGDWVFEKPTVTNDTGVTVNIRALCTGDVNGSYLPAAVKKPATIALKKSGIINLNTSNGINLPLFINKDITLGAVTLSLNIPSAKFDFLSTESKLPGLTYKFANDLLIIAWEDNNPVEINSNEVFLTIKLTVKNYETQSEITINSQSEFADKNGKVLEGLTIYTPELKAGLPVSYDLSQNFPNPFNPETTIKYSLPVECLVKIEVFTPLGQKVKELVNERKPAGQYDLNFNGNNLSSGVYFYSIKAKGVTGNSEYNSVKKLLLLK